MKKGAVLVCLLLLLLYGCSYTTYTTPEGAKVEHWTFMANEKIGELYFLKDATSTHCEIGGYGLRPEEFYLRGYLLGVKVGKEVE